MVVALPPECETGNVEYKVRLLATAHGFPVEARARTRYAAAVRWKFKMPAPLGGGRLWRVDALPQRHKKPAGPAAAAARFKCSSPAVQSACSSSFTSSRGACNSSLVPCLDGLFRALRNRRVSWSWLHKLLREARPSL